VNTVFPTTIKTEKNYIKEIVTAVMKETMEV
jgi:hypothetical protein